MDWPTSLQQYLESDSFAQAFIDPAIRTSMETGPEKTRRRFTGLDKTIQGNIQLHKDDYPTLLNFYDVSVNGGVSPFNILDPITGTPLSVRFTAPPSLTHIGGEYFGVTLSFRTA